MDLRKNWKLCVIVGALLVIITELLLLARFTPTAKYIPLTREQTKAVTEVEIRLGLCENFATSQGIRPLTLHVLEAARADIKDFRESGDAKYLEWADNDIRVAYKAARKPAEVAELYRLLEEAEAIHQNRRADAPSCQHHLNTAARLIQHYASGWNDAIPQMVREETAYVVDVSQHVKPAVTPGLAQVVEAINATRERIGRSGAGIRLKTHGKQAERFFDAWIQSDGHSTLLLQLAQAEAEYVAKIDKDSEYVVQPSEKKTDPAQVLVLIDRFAAALQAADTVFKQNRTVDEALDSVRKSIDFVTKQVVERRLAVPEISLIRQSIEDCEDAMKRVQQQNGAQKFIN